MNPPAFCSSPYAVILAVCAFTAPVFSVFASSPLPTEQHRQAPASSTMVTLSPLAITAFSLVAVFTSYCLIRIYSIVKARYPDQLSTSESKSLPQPVSAGRTTGFSLPSSLSFLRNRLKWSTKPIKTHSRWPPLPAFIRRFTRPSTSLHLSGVQVLPTTMPNSPSQSRSLMDLPLIPRSSPVPISKTTSQQFKHNKLLSRSSSLDTLPTYRPLTPTPIRIPVPMYAVASAPATPPPSSPINMTFTHGSDSAFPLVPITPPKPRYNPPTTTASAGLLTPPLTGSFPAIGLSSFNPRTSTFSSSSSNIGPNKLSSPSPNLFLSSQTISSLSLSPRSLYLQQIRKGKSLGGISVKKISQPRFDLNHDSESEETQDVADSMPEEDPKPEAHTLILPTAKDNDMVMEHKDDSSNDSSKFLITLSTSSSLNSSSSSDSPSPLVTTPPSAPLATFRTVSSSSNSSDIANVSEQTAFLPQPIPLVDVDIDVNANVNNPYLTMGTGYDQAVGWGFGFEEPVEVERATMDFQVPLQIQPIAQTKETLVDLDLEDTQTIKTEDASSSTLTVGNEKWEWDNDLEEQRTNDISQHEKMPMPPPTSNTWTWDAEVEPGQVEHVLILSPSPTPKRSLPVIEMVQTQVHDEEYPDPDLLPLPEVIINDILPLVPIKEMIAPVISVCTHEEVLNSTRQSLVAASSASIKDLVTPVIQSQTPTPPASPPREPRMYSLPMSKPNNLKNNSCPQSQGLDLRFKEVEDEIQNDLDYQVPRLIVIPAMEHDEEMVVREMKEKQKQKHMDMDLLKEGNGVGGDKEKVVMFFDGPLAASPETIYSYLPDSDADGEEEEEDVGIEIAFEYDAEPSVRVEGWDYGYDDDEEKETETQTNQEDVVMDVEEKVSFKVRSKEKDEDEDEDERLPESELNLPSQSESPAPLSPRESPVPLNINAFVPQLFDNNHTDEPETEGTTSTVTNESEDQEQPQTQEESPIPQEAVELPEKPRRTMLEEAVARTRSPLEVALAMQLRPGLGVGADPAWMVRFMMVMWGWMFGMVLTPSA